jgi:uncharacterized protein YqeY
MSLHDQIKQRIKECMKSKNTVERDVLRTVLGEIQSKTISSGKDITDELVEKTLISFKENALECMKYSHNDDPNESQDASEAMTEVEIYDKFLPQYKTVEEIVELLQSSKAQLDSAKSDGQATGMAMGILKKSGEKIQGKDVSEAVKIIREG